MSTRYGRLFAFVLIVLGVVRVTISWIFPLSSDEAYHWEWSRHLAFGYYDHPPMTAYIIAVFTSIFGNNEIGVRFGAIVLMSLTSLIMFRMGKDISGDDRVAFWSGLLVNVIPILNIFFVYMSTDPPTIFFWSLMLWLMYRAVFMERKVYWYLFGLALGAGLMTKFLIVLFIPAAGLFIVLSKKYRRLIASKGPYLAGVIALVVISPFIIWNATHGWATFAFNLAKRQTIEGSPYYIFEYFAGQALVVSPLLFAGFIYLVVHCWRKGSSEQNNLYLFLATTSSVMFAFFLATSFLHSVGAHWPAAGYLSLCVGLPYLAIADKNSLLYRHGRKALATAIGILVLAYSVLFVAWFCPQTLETVVSKFSREADEIYEIHGLENIGDEAEKRSIEHDAILVTPSYAFCSLLSFYTPSQLQTHMFGKGAVHGLNYIFWDGDYSQFIGRDALWVYKESPKKDDMMALEQSFESVENIEEYHVELDGRRIRTFYFIRCRNLIKYSPD